MGLARLSPRARIAINYMHGGSEANCMPCLPWMYAFATYTRTVVKVYTYGRERERERERDLEGDREKGMQTTCKSC